MGDDRESDGFETLGDGLGDRPGWALVTERPRDRSGTIAVLVVAVSAVVSVFLFLALWNSLGSGGDVAESEPEAEVGSAPVASPYLAQPSRVDHPYTWDPETDSTGGSTPLVASMFVLCKANRLDVPREALDEMVADRPTWDKAATQLTELLPPGSVAIPSTGVDLGSVPAPSVIAVSGDAPTSAYVVKMYADADSVTVVDPGAGFRTYATGELGAWYDAAGRKSLYVADLGYTVPDAGE